MDSCGFESQTVHPVVNHYTANVFASTKLMFVRLTIKMLCGSGATLLLIREQRRQLELRKKQKLRLLFFLNFIRGLQSRT